MVVIVNPWLSVARTLGAFGRIPIACRAAGVLASSRSFLLAGGETHECSVRTGCSHAAHDCATELVATGSADKGNSRRATPMNSTTSSPQRFTSTSGSGRPRSDSDQPQVDATTGTHATAERALVLGGGGSVGNAWVIGVIAGLSEAGLDVTDADLVIGTSAGSTAAAQITSGIPPTELLARILAPASQPPTGPRRSERGRTPIGPASDHMDRMSAVIDAAEDAADMRRRMGAAALESDPSSHRSVQTQWRATVSARLPSQHWPQTRLLIPAVDAHTGEPVVFDRDSGVDLVDAVAASTSNGFGIPAYRIGASRYINGGYRRNENADLAAGYVRVLVLSPFGGRSLHPLSWGMQLSTQVDELRASGSRVEMVFPDSSAEHMFGANAMDLSLRPPAARAGDDQGRTLADRLTEFWR
jgi:NTE family protein